MGSLLVKALLGALVNERVVDRLLSILDFAIKKRNDEQTAILRTEVEALHRQNMQRFENVEHGLERLGVKVRNLERAVFADERDLPLLDHPDDQDDR